MAILQDIHKRFEHMPLASPCLRLAQNNWRVERRSQIAPHARTAAGVFRPHPRNGGESGGDGDAAKISSCVVAHLLDLRFARSFYSSCFVCAAAA